MPSSEKYKPMIDVLSRMEMIAIAQSKTLALAPSRTPAQRLRSLELINSAPDKNRLITREMVALIDPAGPAEMQMIDSALSLLPHPLTDDVPGSAIADAIMLLGRDDVFALFVKLNPASARQSSACRNGGLRHDTARDLAGHVDMDRRHYDRRLGGPGGVCGTAGTRSSASRQSRQWRGRNDAGASAIFVTFNDNASTVMVLPNSGGGGNNMMFPSPLMVPAATAFKFTASNSTSTVYCNAQGFTGN
jgi:hypothetical protein